ncbi:MAG: glutamate--tRNA ligase [Dehalococcoidia bacterium]|nr:MAG: glutamate--tRNA ligase [Dehalococcoidia bacterium]
MSERTVRVRFAPSPTGYPHIGNIRTALFNWLFARHHGGAFILRIEDTDQTRKVEGAVDAIKKSLDWLKIDWDEGPYFQSERLQIYHRCIQRLLDSIHAYKCYCSPERLARMREEMAERKESMRSYDRRCRDLTPEEIGRFESQGIMPVIRFKMPLDGQTTFHDLVRGDITFDNSELDDIVLLKSDGYPTYHLANIADDHYMEISHVMRGDEWLSSTPRHVLLYRAFDWEPPLFAHLPMILGPDKSKLSKRHGATSIDDYMDKYLPEAMVNFLALLGWSLDDKTEIFSREELIQNFSIERISRSPAVFNRDKLDWMNGYYLRRDSRPQDINNEAATAPVDAEGIAPQVSTDFVDRLMESLDNDLPPEVRRPTREYVEQIAPLIVERLKTLREAAENFGFFFVDEPIYESGLLLGKQLTVETAIRGLEAALERLQDTQFDALSLEEALRPLASDLGLKTGDFFGLLRIATTGRTAAPPLFETMAVLGKERCLKRIQTAVTKLRESS